MTDQDTTTTQPAPSELDHDNLDQVIGGATAAAVDLRKQEQCTKAAVDY